MLAGDASRLVPCCGRTALIPHACGSVSDALGLDLHDWWTQTAAGYFEHVPKAKALEAVPALAPDQVSRLVDDNYLGRSTTTMLAG